MAAKSETTTTTKTVYNHAWTWINMHTNMLPPGVTALTGCSSASSFEMPRTTAYFNANWPISVRGLGFSSWEYCHACAFGFLCFLLTLPIRAQSFQKCCDGVRVVCKTKSRNLLISYWVSEALSPVHSSIQIWKASHEMEFPTVIWRFDRISCGISSSQKCTHYKSAYDTAKAGHQCKTHLSI